MPARRRSSPQVIESAGAPRCQNGTLWHRIAGRYAGFTPVGTVRKRGKSWRAEVCVEGRRASSSFATKAEAANWILRQEAEFTGTATGHTFADACAKFAREVSPKRKGERWERMRLGRWALSRIGLRPIAKMTPADLGAWRDERLAEVSPGTVRREMGLMVDVFTIARREWGWVKASPLADVRRPPNPPARRRRITDDEIEAMTRALGVAEGLWTFTITNRIGLAFLFALETAMRSGEIIGMHWRDVNLAQRFVTLPRTKNGDRREVALSGRAVEILEALPREDGPCFGLRADQRDALFRKARNRAGLSGFTFHDTRATAIHRLSKKLDVLQLARMIGHRDINSLRHYYAESAAEIARLL